MLAIFPEGALSSSVIVTVWIGVAIVAITNLRFGWVLSGLIVPGYMVPLLIIKPITATVVFAEGVLTYLIVWLYSEWLTRYNGWSTFFGRDRFFALVLASVGVRVITDGWFLPALGLWLDRNYSLNFDYRNNLHSFGLIIVALIANNFWKTGLGRGWWPMFVQVGLTWLITKYGIMEFTNFNISTLGFAYEDIATSMLASPKAYMILLLTAFLASRMNLLYGWDFSGILIPSLLALQWYEPMKIVTTMVEAMVIMGLASLALRLPMLRNITVEGGRKLLLFFNVSFAYKMVLGWAMVLLLPSIKVSDWYGFGYLLPTLIALKMHDKGIFARMSQAVLQTSLAGVAIATVLGFGLVLLPDSRWLNVATTAADIPPEVARLNLPLRQVLSTHKTHFFHSYLHGPSVPPMDWEIDAFAQGIKLLLDYRNSLEPAALDKARKALLDAHYEVEVVSGDYLLLRPRSDDRLWGIYVLSLGQSSRLIVEVPSPLEETGTFEAALQMFEQSRAGAFASAGNRRDPVRQGSSDVLASPRTIFQTFHRAWAAGDVLQVRSRPASESVLHVSGVVPAGLDLGALRTLTQSLKVDFSASAEPDLQRRTTRGAFARLWLSVPDALRVATSTGDFPPLARTTLARTIGGELLAIITPESIAPRASESYRPPQAHELVRINADVLGPLVAAAVVAGSGEESKASEVVRLAAAAGAMLELSVRRVEDETGRYLLIANESGHGGWIVVREGAAAEVVIEVPRPHTESGTLEAAVRAFETLSARAIVIAGAAPDANADRSADILRTVNSQSLFSLAHQVILRETAGRPGVAVQVRAIPTRPEQLTPAEDAVLALDTTAQDRSALDKPVADLLAALERTGMRVRLSAGESLTAGLDATAGPQAAYMNQTKNKRFAVLWISPLVRHALGQEAMLAQRRQFAALGIPITDADAPAYVAARRMSSTTLSAAWRQKAQRYLDNADIVSLDSLRRDFDGLLLERVDDINGRGALLLVSNSDRSLRGVLALSTLSGARDAVKFVKPGPGNARDVADFMASGATWMSAR